MTNAARPTADNPSLEEVNAYFNEDIFAKQAGCSILEAERGHSVCEMKLTDKHKNAAGGIMGGAIFTLADFALAIASNIGEEKTVAVSNSIEFMSTAKGTKLIATANVDKSGRRLGFYTVDIEDDTGRKVARMCATCSR